MRAVGYFQVEGEATGAVVDLEEEFKRFCRLNMHQPVKTFVSIGPRTAHVDEEYDRMVQYLRESTGQFLVVVPGARHLASDLEGVARRLISLNEIGARVSCSSEEFPDPLQNAFQTLGIKGVSRTRSRKIKESMQGRAARGQPLGRPAYGYRIGGDGTLEVVKGEAAVVELIFRLYTKDGLGLRLIAQHLNERGIRTRRGGNWNVVGIRDILKNPAYTGTYTRFGMRRANAHEAIVPPELFRAAQDQTRSRRPVGRVLNPEPFPLSGVLFCAYCGNRMMGATKRQSWKRKDGRRSANVYRYYQCQTRNNQSLCGYHTWTQSALEAAVLGQLKYALVARDAQEQAGARDRSRQEEVRAIMESRVTNAERRFQRAMKRCAKGEMGLKVLGEYLQELDAARRGAATEESMPDVLATLEKWDSLDIDRQRALITEQVARVIVEDDKVEVVV